MEQRLNAVPCRVPRGIEKVLNYEIIFKDDWIYQKMYVNIEKVWKFLKDKKSWSFRA